MLYLQDASLEEQGGSIPVVVFEPSEVRANHSLHRDLLIDADAVPPLDVKLDARLEAQTRDARSNATSNRAR